MPHIPKAISDSIGRLEPQTRVIIAQNITPAYIMNLNVPSTYN